MNKALITDVRPRSPMTIQRLPWLTRLYCYAFHRPSATRRAELLTHLPLQKLFRACRLLRRFPQRGEFAYQRMGRGATIRFDATNYQFSALYASVYKCGYEQEVSVLLDLLLPEGGTFYDVGSNWGYFTLYAASSRARLAIHAFEPFPKSHADLVSCVEQAGIADFVVCHNCALSSQDGEAFIRLPDQMHSGFAEITTEPDATRIVTRRLDTLQLPPPDLIKIDVEGHEVEVLKGGLGTLQASSPFIVFENKRDYGSPAKTLGPLLFLANLGYRLYIPAVRRNLTSLDYFLPCGYQLEIHRMQSIEPQDWLVLVPFEPRERFVYQYDINVFACHERRRHQLAAVFSEC